MCTPLEELQTWWRTNQRHMKDKSVDYAIASKDGSEIIVVVIGGANTESWSNLRRKLISFNSLHHEATICWGQRKRAHLHLATVQQLVVIEIIHLLSVIRNYILLCSTPVSGDPFRRPQLHPLFTTHDPLNVCVCLLMCAPNVIATEPNYAIEVRCRLLWYGPLFCWEKDLHHPPTHTTHNSCHTY